MTIKKILITLLSLVFVFAVSCSSDLGPEASQGNPDDLINNPDGNIAAFVNDYYGVYYEAAGNIDYKLREGKLRNIHGSEVAVEKVSRSEAKLQIRDATEGTVEVLKFDGKGYTSYTSYVLQKVSDDVLIKNNGVGGYIKELIKYKGTYKDVNRNIENFIAIDGEGYIYFYDANVTAEKKTVGLSDNELTIVENQGSVERKLIFKFDQGVYREYNLNGSHIEVTGERFTRTRSFVEDLAGTKYVSADGKVSVEFTSNGATVVWGLEKGTGDHVESIKIGNTIRMRRIATLTLNGDTATYKATGVNLTLNKQQN